MIFFRFFLGFLALPALAGSLQEKVFLEDMKIVLPLVPPGWALARSYRKDDFAGIDDSVAALSGAYERVAIGAGRTAIVLLVEESTISPPPALPHLKRKLLVAEQDTGQPPVLQFENDALLPFSDEGGIDSLGRLSSRGPNQLALGFSSGAPADWQLSLRFEYRAEGFVLVGQSALKGNPGTKAWTRTTEDFTNGSVTTTSGGYDSRGQETNGPTSKATRPLAPLRRLRELNRVVP